MIAVAYHVDLAKSKLEAGSPTEDAIAQLLMALWNLGWEQGFSIRRGGSGTEVRS